MRSTALLATLCTAALAASAGTVDVSFKPAHELSDAGHGSLDRERNLQTLHAHFQSLGARLPDGQRLQVEVTDLDLAGQVRHLRSGAEVRVLTGRADWPSLSLRWSLAAGDRVLAQGDERISELSYLTLTSRRDDRALAYELRLIDRWFDERVRVAAAR